jgi:hypothetical protein
MALTVGAVQRAPSLIGINAASEGRPQSYKTQMEAAMISQGAVEGLLARVRDWWRRQNELSLLDSVEVDRIAGDLGMRSDTLRDLIARGPDAANLLYERMRALGMSKADVDHAAWGVMRDLQRTCACCNEKGVCEKDLVEHPGDPVWKDYCPNAVTLDALSKLKGRG